MESTEQRAPVFSLYIEGRSKSHLSAAAKWARLLAIAGIIMLVLIIAGVVGLFFYIQYIQSLFDSPATGTGLPRTQTILVIIYILMLSIWFFPLGYLFQFASRTRKAILGNSVEELEISFQNLKQCFRFVGITLFIFFVFYIAILVFGLVGRTGFDAS